MFFLGSLGTVADLPFVAPWAQKQIVAPVNKNQEAHLAVLEKIKNTTT